MTAHLVMFMKQEVNRDSQVMAANGHALPALQVFAHTLRYLKSHVTKELMDQGFRPTVRWVVTVPALWTQQAKQFVREAAYLVSKQAGEIWFTSPIQVERYINHQDLRCIRVSNKTICVTG